MPGLKVLMLDGARAGMGAGGSGAGTGGGAIGAMGVAGPGAAAATVVACSGGTAIGLPAALSTIGGGAVTLAVCVAPDFDLASAFFRRSSSDWMRDS